MAEIPTPTTGYSAPSGDRPLGVTILAVLEWIGAILVLITAIGLIALGAAIPLFGALGLIFGVIMLLLALVSFIIGYGLFTLKSWAWMLAIIFNILDIILGIVAFDIITIIISLIIVIYLQQGDIKSRFR
jgi:uncharacterized membrane protein (DUF2068 family)